MFKTQRQATAFWFTFGDVFFLNMNVNILKVLNVGETTAYIE